MASFFVLFLPDPPCKNQEFFRGGSGDETSSFQGLSHLQRLYYKQAKGMRLQLCISLLLSSPGNLKHPARCCSPCARPLSSPHPAECLPTGEGQVKAECILTGQLHGTPLPVLSHPQPSPAGLVPWGTGFIISYQYQYFDIT